MPPPAYRIAHKTPHSSMSMPHIFSEPRGPPGFGSAIRYPLSALAARRRPRSRRYSPPTYCAIARSPPWARGYHNHRSPVPPLGTSNGTVDACMIQSKMLRSISLGSGRGVILYSTATATAVRGTAAINPYRIFTCIIHAAALAAAVLTPTAALRLAPVEGACAEARPLRVCSELLA